MSRYFWITLFIFAGLAVPAEAQEEELGELIQDVGEAYSQPYLQPLADALGAGMNTGLFHSARIGGGLLPVVDVYAGVKLMGAMVPSNSRSFSMVYETEQVFRGPDGNDYRIPVTFTITDAPTVFGDRTPGVAEAHVQETVAGPDGDVTIDTTATFDVLPGLVNTPVAPFFVPQIGIGSFMGTDVTLRYLPRIGYQDFGSIGFIGFGVRHSISQYIPLFPISLSGQVMWQKLSIEDGENNEVFGASAFAGNVVASKSLLLVTVYGGLQVERSSVDVAYMFDPGVPSLPAQQIEFGLTGGNVFRAVGGFALNFGPMLVNFDAGVGNSTVVSGGVGLSL